MESNRIDSIRVEPSRVNEKANGSAESRRCRRSRSRLITLDEENTRPIAARRDPTSSRKPLFLFALRNRAAAPPVSNLLSIVSSLLPFCSSTWLEYRTRPNNDEHSENLSRFLLGYPLLNRSFRLSLSLSLCLWPSPSLYIG